MLHKHPYVARLMPRLITQFVPAALVTVVGVLLLSNLTKTSTAVPPSAPVQTAISTEAVFTMTPRAAAEADEPPTKAAARAAAARPKTLTATVPTPPRKPADEPAPRQIASAPLPLPTVQISAQPQAPARDSSIMGTILGPIRSTGTAVLQMPQQAARSVTGWFAGATPPRPPAPIPAQNFQAAM